MPNDNNSVLEINVYNGGRINLATDNGTIYQDSPARDIVIKKSRTQEYFNKWNSNMFLNNYDARDETSGVNIKLSEVYIENNLPHYKWKNNAISRDDLKKLLEEYISFKSQNKMLLILGQPGIGKSTLITWITANFSQSINDIYVYQFSSDLKNINWNDENISQKILFELNLRYESLNNTTLIIDGLDEINIQRDKIQILNNIYWELIREASISNFSLIITCRENYIQDLSLAPFDYIILRPWTLQQIYSFTNIYSQITHSTPPYFSDAILEKNKEILGIPLILYMVLSLNIPIKAENSIVDIYDQIFSLENGGIYERCIKNFHFEKPHRISKIKEQIHQLSKEISIWMFENSPSKNCIPYKEYQVICSNVIYNKESKDRNMDEDVLIGNFFKLVKHLEGSNIYELYFVHRSIYEYFVAETIYSSIMPSLTLLTLESQVDLAKNIGGRKIFCVYGEKSSLIRTRYV